MSALNNSPLLGASGSQGYFLQRSVRTRSSASAYFNRTPASAGSLTTWTWSGWVKRGLLSSSSTYTLFSGGAAGTITTNWIGFVNDSLAFSIADGTYFLASTAVYRDPSAWYHVVVAYDSSNATAANRMKMYVNGVQITAFSTATYPTINYAGYINGANSNFIGLRASYGDRFFDGYLTEINFIDGQALTPTSFGEYNSTTGVWQPKKYAGTYGTNGFYLNFQDNSGATATTIGKDSSGNGNNWTPNNISVTAGVTYDSMTDVPTNTSPTNANYAVLNPLFGSTNTISNANLTISGTTSGNTQRIGSLGVSSGKWYFETTMATNVTAGSDFIAGISNLAGNLTTNYTGQASDSYAAYAYGSNTFLQKLNNTVFTNTSATQVVSGDVIGIAFDLDNLKFWISKNGVWVDSGDPAAGTNSQYTVTSGTYIPSCRASGGATNSSANFNFGQRPFSYTPPTGFVALNTYNLPAPTIKNGAEYMAASLYTGTGAALSVSNAVNGKSFQPDLVWLKGRSVAYNNYLYDSVRGALKELYSDSTSAEVTATQTMTSFNSGGFSVGTNTGINQSAATFVGWNWKASNAAAVTNTSGSISSQVSANPTAGFSIVTWTGNGVNGASIGHGLNTTPAMAIIKNRSAASTDWVVLNKGVYGGSNWNSTILGLVGYTNILYLNSTSAAATLSNIAFVNGSGNSMLAYFWAEIPGFSKFGSYTGNGSADGTFVYLGFRPRLVMIKGSSFVSNWFIQDSARNGYNVNNGVALRPNLTSAEDGTTTYNIDILSNGFKLRSSAADANTNGATFIYAAFAESPFNYSLAR